MTEAELRNDIAQLVDWYKESQRLGAQRAPDRVKLDSLNVSVEALVVKLGTQIAVDFHRIADALESIAYNVAHISAQQR